MSFLIDTLYGVLKLTDAQKAQVNAALPAVKDVLDAVDAHLGDIDAIRQLVTTNPTLLKQLMADWAVIGPNMSAATVDGNVDLFVTMGAYNDAKAHIAANPKTVQAATVLYNKLAPVINQLIADWPKIRPAVQVLRSAASQNNVSMTEVFDRLKP